MINRSDARKLYEKSVKAKMEKTKKDYFYTFLDNEIIAAAEMGVEELTYEVYFKEKLDYYGIQLELVSLHEKNKLTDRIDHLTALGYEVTVYLKHEYSPWYSFSNKRTLVGFKFKISWE